MYEVWKLANGVKLLDAQLRDPNLAREHAIEQSNLNDAVYTVMREGFDAPLYFVYRGQPMTALDAVSRLTQREVPPVVCLEPPAPEDAPKYPPPDKYDPANNPMIKPRRVRKGPEEVKSKRQEPSDFKTFPATVTSVDDDQGIVDALVAILGNIDLGDDIIFPGAFTKTLAENGNRIKVLDGHQNRSTSSVIGRPLEIREVGRDAIPADLLARYPEIQGALFTRTQYLLSVPEGKGAYERIKSGLVDQYSIGFDPIVAPIERVTDPRTGKTKTIRALRELKLYEYSPVVFAMNDLTRTLAVKAADAPTDAKPYSVFPMHDEYCVFRVDEAGERMGDSLGCHATEQEALQQIAAIEANEDGKSRKEYTPQGPKRCLGDCLMADMMEAMTFIMGRQLRDGMLSGDEHGQMMGMCATHVNALRAEMPDEMAMRPMPEMPMFMFAGTGPNDTKVGRVLSAANFAKIEQASTLLSDVLSAATPADNQEGTDGDKSREGSAPDTDGPQESPATPTPDAKGAGPLSEEAPAAKQSLLLEQLKQRLAEVEG